jgi:hypothetical protein
MPGQHVLREYGVAAERVVPTARDARHRNRRAEIVRKPLALLFRRRVQEPHQHEEGHHGRHEIRIGDFPRTPVVAAACGTLFLPLDDDWRDIAVTSHLTLFLPPRQRVSATS